MTEEGDTPEENPWVVRDKEGYPVVQVGLRATLYFLEAYRPEVREAVATSVDRLQGLMKPHLRWVEHPKSGKMYPHGSSRVPALRAWLAKRSSDQAWEYYLHGGEHPDASSHFMIEAFGPPDWGNRPGSLSFALPCSWLEDHPGQFPDLVLELCNQLNPVHGYGGLGILESFDVGVVSHFEPAAYALARRYPGLEVDDPVSHARYLREGIKGVNWLTVVGESFLPAVGGGAALRAILGEDFSIREYAGGVLIQAGPRPLRGDTNAGDIPALYRRVAKALRPIRVQSVGSLHHGGEHRFTTATSDEWLRRFDDP